MGHLEGLATELLAMILDYVGPSNFENFALSCPLIYGIAKGKRLEDYHMYKTILTEVGNNSSNPTQCGFLDLLDIILHAPRLAEHVKALTVGPWETLAGSPRNPSFWLTFWHIPQSISEIRAFEEVLTDTKSVTSKEIQKWTYRMRAGNQNPVIALLLLRLDCINSLVLVLDDRRDFFIFPTLQRIAKDPHPSSLSQLRKVEIRSDPPGVRCAVYLTTFATLPSVISLKAYRLREFDVNSARSSLELHFQTSNLRDLELEACVLSYDSLFKLICNPKSLRSFSYSFSALDGPPAFVWIYNNLLECANTSLEELTLRCSPSSPVLHKFTREFESFDKLRILTINYDLLVGDQNPPSNEVAFILPRSLESLTLEGCRVEEPDWLLELVEGMALVKDTTLPNLKELVFENTVFEREYERSELAEVFAVAEQVGIAVAFSSVHRAY